MSKKSELPRVSLETIVNGLKDGSITLLDQGHMTNPLVDKLERKLNHINEQIADYEAKIAKGIKKDGKVECKGMIDFYKVMLSFEVGQYLGDSEQYCFDCGANMYIMLIDEKTIGYIPSGRYWQIAEKSGKKYGYRAKAEDCECCEAKPLTDAQKLTAEINVPTGKLVFQNFFRAKELYELKGEEYHSINGLMGRNELMQDLATRDVGYGQMGNMSVNIYSNGKEILIGSDLECYEDNKAYHEEEPDTIDDEWIEESKKAEEFKAMLKEGKFKDLGSISLSVWRWMCADAQVIEPYDEEVDSDRIVVDIPVGTYVIEHYYDFPKNGDSLYSKITLK